MYTTFYRIAKSKPKQNVLKHDDLGDAIKAWEKDCGALPANSGGYAVIMLEPDGMLALKWEQHSVGSFAVGPMVDNTDIENLDYHQIAKKLLKEDNKPHINDLQLTDQELSALNNLLTRVTQDTIDASPEIGWIKERVGKMYITNTERRTT